MYGYNTIKILIGRGYNKLTWMPGLLNRQLKSGLGWNNILLVYLLISSISTQAQQVFPVSTSGVLIPPNSLNLQDYANARGTDLFFTVSLNDPIETMVPVKFRLTVMHNGQDILVTDPNYNPPPFMLNQFQPEMLDGMALAPYLERSNLLGGGQNPENNLIPEGFNQICLEVIHYDRQVPISPKACVFGNFRLNDPPLLQKPFCGEEIPTLDPQTLFF